MVTISKNNISEWLLLDTYSEMHIAKDKLNYYQKKYGTSFSGFEKKINAEKESFEHYDDYIEWKAYNHLLQSIEKKMHDIRNGNVKIS